MFQSSLAFAFSPNLEPPVLSAARALAARIEAGEVTDRQALNRVLTEHFGGSDAQGFWSVRDAHAVLEFAQVLWLKNHSALTPRSAPGEALAAFDRLDALLPSQTIRSEEQIELQQFSTPPRLAWLAARAGALRATELALEPSAGTGMLAVWGANAGARLALNEIARVLRTDGLFVHETRVAQHLAHPVRSFGRSLPWTSVPVLAHDRAAVLWGVRRKRAWWVR